MFEQRYGLVLLGLAVSFCAFLSADPPAEEPSAAALDTAIKKLVEEDTKTIKKWEPTHHYLQKLKEMASQHKAQWEQAAKQGSPEAMILLGQIYMNGVGVKRDTQRGGAYYQQAVEKGCPQGMLWLASIYQGMADFPVDMDKALKLIQQAADLGDPEALTALGSAYLWGDGIVQKDRAKGLAILEKAKETGYAPALSELGFHYLYLTDENEKEPTPEEKKKGFAYIKQAAEKGDAQASRYLADCYLTGEGTPVNKAQGMAILNAMIAKGDEEAMLVLAQHYLWNEEGDENTKMGIQWLRKSVAKGDPFAMNLLGECYLDGQGVPKDPQKAIQWFEKAAEAPFCGLNAGLAIRFLKGEGIPRDIPRAVKWFKKAVEEGGEPMSLAFMSYCCTKGLGTAKDPKAAKEYFRKAAAYRNGQAFYDVVEFAETQSPENLEEETRILLPYLQKAAEFKHPDAMLKLGLLYVCGGTKNKLLQGKVQDGLTILESAVKRGSQDAKTFMGRYFYTKAEEEKDKTVQVELYKKSAANGFEPAQKWLKKHNAENPAANEPTLTPEK